MSIVAVAKRAGVSVATVSRVLNDLNNVRPETARQVRQAMQELGYKPPRVKRGPKGGPRRSLPSCMTTGQLAVLTLGSVQHWLSMPVLASVVTGMTRATKEMDIRLLLDEMPDPAVLSPVLRRREVDGALAFVQSGVAESRLVELGRHLPLVWVMGGEAGAPAVDHVSADNIGIGYLALDYLASKGCEHLAFITDQPNWHIMRLRGQAFANAARDVQQWVSAFVLAATPLEAEPYGARACAGTSLENLVDQLAAAQPRPTGLFIPTDLLTTQVYPLLIQRGILPGKHITVVSCDYEKERLALLKPPPASIDLRGEHIGRAAVRQLIQRMQHPEQPAARVQIVPRIVCSPEHD